MRFHSVTPQIGAATAPLQEDTSEQRRVENRHILSVQSQLTIPSSKRISAKNNSKTKLQEDRKGNVI